MFQGGNMTGYEAYPPMDYMKEYNKTGMLHLKYKTMNQTEVPQMKFAKRQDKLNLNIINNIDLDNVIRSNNITPLENISGNLIYQEIKEEDFEDPNLPKLLKTFQYALEYLYTKQTKLDKTNKKLSLEYNQLINQSFEIEEKLKSNKQEINEQKRIKKEHEMLLLTYESLVNFNINPTEGTNIIMKNIKSNYDENISSFDKNRIQKMGTGDYQKSARFYCHICNGKYFNTEIGLENHMKRRHLAQIRQNSQREKEELKVEEIQEIYDKKLEETKNHFQNLLMKQNEMISKTNLQEEINNMNREKDEKLKLLLENNKNVGKLFKDFQIKQDEFNERILNLAKDANEKNENKEIPKITIENPLTNDINKLINTVENLGETLKNKENKSDENDIKMKLLIDINNKIDKMKNPTYPNSFQNNNNISNNINKNINLNPPNDNNNINKDVNLNPPIVDNNINKNLDNINNNNINDKKSSEHLPKNTLLDIPKKDEEIVGEKENISSKKNNFSQNEKSNILPQKIEQPDEDNNKKNDNTNIISQGDFIDNYRESQMILDPDIKNSNIIDIVRQKKEEDEKNEKEINISQLNNNILDSNIEGFQNIVNNGNLKNIQNQNPINDNDQNKIQIGINQEAYQVIKNDGSKTDPTAFKQEKERDLDIENDINLKALKTFSKGKTNDKLYNFFKSFTNRDQIILNKKDPKISDLNGFTEEIVNDQDFNMNIKDSKNMQNFIENNVEEIKDLDKKSQGELLDIIKNTLNKINKINEKGQVAGLYFETMNRAIDLKMLENEEKMMREAYNKRGELKRTRSKSSKAKIVIEQTNKEFEGSDNL